jgi:hypothetical protein
MNKETVPPDDDALMGAQLTEQYRRATAGMREVLRLGATILKIRPSGDEPK